jgi:hypothetical protein
VKLLYRYRADGSIFAVPAPDAEYLARLERLARARAFWAAFPKVALATLDAAKRGKGKP